MSPLARLNGAMLVAIAAATCGCTVSDRDVSDDPHFLVGYRPGQVYELAQPVHLLRVEQDCFDLVPPGEKKAYGRVAGTLPAGSRIKILSLRHTVTAAPIQWESGVTTDVELVEQPDWIIGLNDISGVQWVEGDRGMKTGVLIPDPKWLVLVQPVRDDAAR